MGRPIFLPRSNHLKPSKEDKFGVIGKTCDAQSAKNTSNNKTVIRISNDFCSILLRHDSAGGVCVCVCGSSGGN